MKRGSSFVGAQERLGQQLGHNPRRAWSRRAPANRIALAQSPTVGLNFAELLFQKYMALCLTI